MAGMFFTMQEVVDKLSKTEGQIQELIQEGKLREFRDGTKLLFKVSEVEALDVQLPHANNGEPIEILPNDSEAVLMPATEPSAPAVPTSSVPDLDIIEDAPVEFIADDILLADDDDDLLLADINLEDSHEDLLVDAELPAEELSLEDSLSLLAGDDNSDGTSFQGQIDLDSGDELISSDDSLDILIDDDLDIVIEEEAVDVTIEDAADETTVEIAEAVEDISIEPETVDVTDDISGDSEVVIMSDETSDGISIDEGDSMQLADATAAVEEVEEDFDLADSFDMLMSDDTTSGVAIESDGGLLSNETLGGLLSTNVPIDDEDELLSSLTKADTAMGNTGINILAESDSDYQLASDTKAETAIPEDDDDEDFDDLSDLSDLDIADGDDDAFLSESAGLGDLDDDLNLDSIGSGSGLLDLSLQADDTSLGAVLDDILPSDDEIDAAPMELDDGSLVDEDEDVFVETSSKQMLGASAPTGQIARYAEAPPTAVENACGIAMFLPAIMVAYAAIILLFGLKGITPKLLTQVTGDMAGIPIIWWIVIGTSVLFLLILMLAALMGGGSGPKKEKNAKAKKVKKTKKPKKAKKKK